MPRPSSRTSIRQEPFALRDARARRAPPSGEYLTALSTRLTSTCRSLSSSQRDRRGAVGARARARSTPGTCSAGGLDHARGDLLPGRTRSRRARPRRRRAGRRAGSGRRSSPAASPRTRSSRGTASGLLSRQLDVVAPQRARRRRRPRRAACAARARRSRRSRCASARARAPRSRPAARRRCPRRSRRRRPRPSARAPPSTIGTVTGRAALAGRAPAARARSSASQAGHDVADRPPERVLLARRR